MFFERNHQFPIELTILCYSTLSMFFMTLPVLLCLCFVPLACCCFPCFVRFLLAMRVTESTMVGATQQDLDTLPSKQYDPITFNHNSDDDKAPQCAICLSTYVPGELVRELPCDSRHHFHKTCVDDWLKLNATCPVCRSRLFPVPSTDEVHRTPAGFSLDFDDSPV